ncbi:hypothetical protein [Pseudomonas sp. Ant30-3]|uniref:hypothetical protein n=1 Tax=Pseudomonas sp. Ant30-3 TaxID=1488328 RepID=UPI001F3BDE49|nr:hypothetical protein [Pseudomonas sp. Ant30-3]
MAVAVPLQIKTLPAGFEERVEADIIVLIRTLDLARLKQALPFRADLFPMDLQRAEVRKIGRVEVRPVGNFRAQIQEAIDRRQERRVVAQLPAQFVAHVTAQMNVRNRNNIDSSDDQFQGNRHTSEVNKLRLFRPFARGLSSV